MSAGLLALTVFVATSVEMVEALTIVLAVGVSRGWRSALQGASAAVVILAVLVAVFGDALATKAPIHLLQSVVGIALLLFGLSWLQKAVARAAGRRPHRDESASFERLVGRLADGSSERRSDPMAFVVAFKGVFLEGLEAAIIAITFGAAAQKLGIAFASAGIAVLGVSLAGAIVYRPLSRVPENAMKLGVGLLLTSFGTFWVAEGLGVGWPGSEFTVLYIVAAYSVVAFTAVRLLARPVDSPQKAIPRRYQESGDEPHRRANEERKPLLAGEDGRGDGS